MKKWNEKYHDKFKKHSLSSELMDMRNLKDAWYKVRMNKGCAGIDGESIERFGAQEEQNLLEIRRLLKERRYVPQPVRRVYIPKPDGRQRPLGIPTVRDRVVQQAVRNIIEPIFENIFLPCSFGYRPNRSAHQAIRKAEEYLEDGYHWVVDADIQGFFDHVNHQILVDLVREKIADGRILDMVEAILKSGVMQDGCIAETREGTPQGGVISPLFANIYLHHFDRRMKEECFEIVRYADDILIFCKTEWWANRALEVAKRILEKELHLLLNPVKTKIIMAKKNGVEFLGMHFNGRWNHPQDDAIQTFKDEIRYQTKRNQPRNPSMVIQNINPMIRGWGRYFGIGTNKTLYRNLDCWIRGRIRCFKAKKRTNNVLRYILPISSLQQMKLVTLESLIAW